MKTVWDGPYKSLKLERQPKHGFLLNYWLNCKCAEKCKYYIYIFHNSQKKWKKTPIFIEAVRFQPLTLEQVNRQKKFINIYTPTTYLYLSLTLNK